MFYYAIKLALSALIVVAVSEIAKRSTALAAFVASLPLTSLLAFIWLKIDGEPTLKIADLSGQIFWLILPSLVLFLVLPWMLRSGFSFWASLGAACAATGASYGVMTVVLRKAGIEI